MATSDDSREGAPPEDSASVVHEASGSVAPELAVPAPNATPGYAGSPFAQSV